VRVLVDQGLQIFMPELDAATIDQIATKVFRRETSLNDEAEKYTIDEVLQSFSNLRLRMVQIINGLTSEQVNYNADPETYSLSEVISHLISAQGNVYNALLDIGASTLPHIDPIPRGAGAGAEKGLSSQILQERLQKATYDLIAVARQTFDPNGTTRVEIGPFGKLSHKGALLFQLYHDLDHLKQSQTVRRSPSFPKAIKKDGGLTATAEIPGVQE
jgi:hypothetical protein